MAARPNTQAQRAWSLHCHGGDILEGAPFQEIFPTRLPSDYVVRSDWVGSYRLGLSSAIINHFVAVSPVEANSLAELLKRVHSITAREANRVHGSHGQRVWHQYWDTHLTYERSYYARLNYVHQNSCRHRLVPLASNYPWCSAAWFERIASPGFVKTVSGFKTDTISIHNDFEVILEKE